MDRYDLYRQAEKTGKCELCGWRDGEGVRVCYYDKDFGALTHQNSIEGAKLHMTESQRELVDSFESTIYGVMDSKTRLDVKCYLEDKARIKKDAILGRVWDLGVYFSAEKYKTKSEVVEAWIKYEDLEKYLKDGYKIVRTHKESNAKGSIFEDFRGERITYDLKKPHCCGGFAVYVAPYHIKCSKCDEEVRLWEFGIAYDVG